MSKESTFSALFRIAAVATLMAGLAGCQVLASLSEEGTLRMLAVFVAVAVLVGFVVAKMRR